MCYSVQIVTNNKIIILLFEGTKVNPVVHVFTLDIIYMFVRIPWNRIFTTRCVYVI